MIFVLHHASKGVSGFEDTSVVRDNITVLYGAPTPFVVRAKGKETLQSTSSVIARVVGECYMYDVMDGETIGDKIGRSVIWKLV